MIDMIFFTTERQKIPEKRHFSMTKSATMSQKMTLFSDSVPSQLKAKSLSQTEHHKGEKKTLSGGMETMTGNFMRNKPKKLPRQNDREFPYFSLKIEFEGPELSDIISN